ncbi:MAG: sigma-54-dependent Fis family transcriptional regulator [Planctomycetes bacterium]|nr:sigma-54-dependent Fis family transcriptional regulator [Planctomycetota bacterium]
MQQNILLVEDDRIVRDSTAELLTHAGYRVSAVDDGPIALELSRKMQFSGIILDLTLPTMHGLEVLERLQKNLIYAPIIILTADSNHRNAIRAIKSGATDYITKPFDADELLDILNKSISRYNGVIDEVFKSERIIGDSPAIRKTLDLIRKSADSDANVLIYGETGTGKDLAARTIHLQGRRKDKPFVKIDCATLPEEIIESELFGHNKGAFTGAVDSYTGRFTRANTGTIFLDEISNLSLRTQAKLLNIIQDREITPLRSTAKIKIDIRIISATNRKLENEIKDGRFRKDLFYRLGVIPLNMAPLREHRDDIDPLCGYFIGKFAALEHKPAREIEPAALEILAKYDWPGNVRELSNLINQMLVIPDSTVIRVEDLPANILESRNVAADSAQVGLPFGLRDSTRLSEFDRIKQILNKTNGNKTKAAKLLGISRVTLHKKIQQNHIRNPF